MKSIRLVIRWLPVAFALLLVAALSALAWGRIGRTVDAAGEVRVKQYQVLRPKVDGIVAEVLVEPGEEVRPGDTIVRLLDYEFDRQHLAVRQQLHDAEIRRLSISRKLGQLQREIHPLERSRQSKQVESDRLQDRVAVSRTRELEIELKRAAEALRRMQELHEAGLVSEEVLNETRFDQLQVEERFEQSKIEQELSRERVGDAVDQSDLLEAEQRASVGELETELGQLDLLLEQLRQDLARLDAIADEYAVRSEIAGVLVTESTHELRGLRVAAGDDLGSIIDLEAVHFVTYVPEAAILKVRDGQGAAVELTGLPKRSFDVFEGVVHKIGAEPSLDAEGEQILYPVEIRLRKPWVVWEGDRFYVRSGMRGEAEIAYRADVSMLRAIYESIVGEPGLSRRAEEPRSDSRGDREPEPRLARGSRAR